MLGFNNKQNNNTTVHAANIPYPVQKNNLILPVLNKPIAFSVSSMAGKAFEKPITKNTIGTMVMKNISSNKDVIRTMAVVLPVFIFS